ncbi:ankyrin [Colletotrichum eremochloae]|nr:ankyrin [Colletotrichum eremochloae]
MSDSPTGSVSSRLSGDTVVGRPASWSSGCSTSSTLLDNDTSSSLIRAIFVGDLLTAGDLLARGIPVPGIPAVQGLMNQPELNLNRTTNSDKGDRIIHFLLRISAESFQDDKTETLKTVFQRGVNLTQQGAQGDTVLHLLCGPLGSIPRSLDEEPNVALLHFLLDGRNDYGNTPLLVAVLYGFEGCVTYLLERGADPEIRGEEGRKPLSWAIQREHMGIVNALLNHGATFDKDIARETDVLVMKRIIENFCKDNQGTF